jgi:hypothetical protein
LATTHNPGKRRQSDFKTCEGPFFMGKKSTAHAKKEKAWSMHMGKINLSIPKDRITH